MDNIFATPNALCRQKSLNITPSSLSSPFSFPSNDQSVLHAVQMRWNILNRKWTQRSVYEVVIAKDIKLGIRLKYEVELTVDAPFWYATDRVGAVVSKEDGKDGVWLQSGDVVEALNNRNIQDWKVDEIRMGLKIRPLTLRIRNSMRSKAILCRLCETLVDAAKIENHLRYCIMSNKSEVNAQVCATALGKIANSIRNRLRLENSRIRNSKVEEELYKIMEQIADRASRCNMNDIDTLGKYAELLKKLLTPQFKQPMPLQVVSRDSERALKYHIKVKRLIEAAMSAMRKMHKSQLQLEYAGITDSSANSSKTNEKEKIQHKQNVLIPTIVPPATQVAMHAPNSPFYRSVSLGERRKEKERFNTGSEQRDDSPSHGIVNLSISDFEIIKPISKGAYGKVYLAKKKTTGDRYAIKVLAKEHILRKKQAGHIETERTILARSKSPFVVKLFWTFQSAKHLFLVMEYLPGGDFMSLLDHSVRLDEEVVRIYLAETVLALKYLHSRGCVHRDLKPDNILISQDGHIKLTDFGLSEEGVGMMPDDAANRDSLTRSHRDSFELEDLRSPKESSSSWKSDPFLSMYNTNQYAPLPPPVSGMFTPYNSMADDNTLLEDVEDEIRGRSLSSEAPFEQEPNIAPGTPDYLSPEIILGRDHGPPVDFWALGVIMYEMLVGVPPFNDETVEAIFANILQLQIEWPEDGLSASAVDLIFNLLKPNPLDRPNINEIMAHPFFNGINWQTIRSSEPPFRPSLEGKDDTSYFNNRNLTDIFIEEDCFDLAATTATTKVEVQPPLPKKSSSPNIFTSFSFTNMNALIEAVRAEAKQKANVSIEDRNDADSPRTAQQCFYL